MKRAGWLLLVLASVLLLTGCIRPGAQPQPWKASDPEPTEQVTADSNETLVAQLPPTRLPDTPYYTPTPDAPHPLPTIRPNTKLYVVQYGDSLGYIATKYNLELETLIAANETINPDWIEIGQVINVPAPQPSTTPSDFKIIPDSELVFGPASATLDLKDFIKSRDGYLSDYRQEVEDVEMSGIQIVRRISQEFSINPRLLLALLEYRSGWVTTREIDEFRRDYPMGYAQPLYKGLYMQLAWTANQLNRGYYLWRINALSHTNLSDGTLAPLSPTINAGTAAVQYMLGFQSNADAWQKAVGKKGVYRTYTDFFGIPFDRTIDPLLPPGLAQPEMELPFEEGAIWSFTSGPHAGWGSGSAWAALDFAPPGDLFGCFVSNEWVTASADGLIIRSGDGAVVLDLDGDGLEQTGWTILYMHIETRDRIAAGTQVKTGDRIGHPSCEGGYSNGTHVHLARRYNGEWISADTNVPFVLSGWVSAGECEEYCGTLHKDGNVVYSWDGRVDDNQIGR